VNCTSQQVQLFWDGGCSYFDFELVSLFRFDLLSLTYIILQLKRSKCYRSCLGPPGSFRSTPLPHNSPTSPRTSRVFLFFSVLPRASAPRAALRRTPPSPEPPSDAGPLPPEPPSIRTPPSIRAQPFLNDPPSPSSRVAVDLHASDPHRPALASLPRRRRCLLDPGYRVAAPIDPSRTAAAPLPAAGPKPPNQPNRTSAAPTALRFNDAPHVVALRHRALAGQRSSSPTQVMVTQNVCMLCQFSNLHIACPLVYSSFRTKTFAQNIRRLHIWNYLCSD
jgi:hypothetical protein